MMEAVQDGEHLGMKGPSYQFGSLKRPRPLGSGTGIPDDIIRVNAGGKVFTCLRSTLCQHPGSFFARLFDPSSCVEDRPSVQYDEEGNVFLDVQPPLFEAMLSALRTQRLLDSSCLRELPPPSVAPCLRPAWTAFLRHVGLLTHIEMLHHDTLNLDPQLCTLGPGDQVHVMDEGRRCVVGQAAHGLSLVASQVLRPGKAYVLKLSIQRGTSGVTGPSDMRWGFVRQRTCTAKPQQQQEAASSGPQFLTPQVGGDHRCSWPSEGGVFLLKLDLRAGPGGHSLSVLNLQTRGPMRVAEVPFDEDGWRLCGALTGPAALHCSSTDIGAQEHAVAEMLSAAGGLMNSEGRPVARGAQAMKLFHDSVSPVDPCAGMQQFGGGGMNLGAAFANGLDGPSLPERRRDAETYYCGVSYVAPPSTRSTNSLMRRQNNAGQENAMARCVPTQGPCPSCQGLLDRFRPCAVMWGDVALDLLPVTPADLQLILA